MLDRDMCRKLGLSFEDIRWHQNKVKATLAQNDQIFKIVDTCRTDNFGVLPSRVRLCGGTYDLSGFVPFVPAAGASSRYRMRFDGLVDALVQRDSFLVKRVIDQYKSANLDEWPIPQAIDDLLATADVRISDDLQLRLLDILSKPKALFPCVTDGLSFLAMKCMEHAQLRGVNLQVFIAPKGMTSEFLRHAKRHSHMETQVFEQGDDLATIRFDKSGEPIVDAGLYSAVPAGHGALIKLLRKGKKLFPEHHSVFIRNIDNVTGCSMVAKEDTEAFLAFHERLLHLVFDVRERLLEDLGYCLNLVNQFITLEMPDHNPTLKGTPEEQITRFFDALFGTPDPSHSFSLKALKQRLDRPVTTMGVVRNSGSDVGGAPVIAKTPLGVHKLCIEMPHASKDDVQFILANPQKTTHFNPVFLANELTELGDESYPEDHPFWLIAEKNFKGDKVYYFESLLYEILGNDKFCNLCFVEIPRRLFNPHKDLFDTQKRCLADWL